MSLEIILAKEELVHLLDDDASMAIPPINDLEEPMIRLHIMSDESNA